jgi:hypothetical protein
MAVLLVPVPRARYDDAAGCSTYRQRKMFEISNDV